MSEVKEALREYLRQGYQIERIDHGNPSDAQEAEVTLNRVDAVDDRVTLPLRDEEDYAFALEIVADSP